MSHEPHESASSSPTRSALESAARAERLAPFHEATARRYERSAQLEHAACLYEPDVDLFVYQRSVSAPVCEAAERLATSGFRRLQQAIAVGETGVGRLSESLKGERALARDLLGIAEILADLVGTELVGLRLECATNAMCPRFHVDRVLVRAVVAYTGEGSEWLREVDVDRQAFGAAPAAPAQPWATVQQVSRFDVAFMKGQGWPGNEVGGLVHRSPAVQHGPRLVASFDPLHDS